MNFHLNVARDTNTELSTILSEGNTVTKVTSCTDYQWDRAKAANKWNWEVSAAKTVKNHRSEFLETIRINSFNWILELISHTIVSSLLNEKSPNVDKDNKRT